MLSSLLFPILRLSCAFISLDSSICKDFIYDKLKIFTNHSSNETSIAREKRALDLRTMVNYEVPLGKCRDLGHSIMCHVVYPYCDARPRERAPSRLCKSVCDEFVSGDCMGLISNDSSFYKFIMENCDERVSGGGEPPECISLSLKAFRNGWFHFTNGWLAVVVLIFRFKISFKLNIRTILFFCKWQKYQLAHIQPNNHLFSFKAFLADSKSILSLYCRPI